MTRTREEGVASTYVMSIALLLLTARRMARANGVRIVTCRMDAEVATVTTRAELNTPFGAWGVKARARAAPDYYFE